MPRVLLSKRLRRKKSLQQYKHHHAPRVAYVRAAPLAAIRTQPLYVRCPSSSTGSLVRPMPLIVSRAHMYHDTRYRLIYRGSLGTAQPKRKALKVY